MPASALEPILRAHGLTFYSQYVRDRPPSAQIYLPRLERRPYTDWKQAIADPEARTWEQRLADPLVAWPDITPTAYVDGFYLDATVTFVQGASDQEIEDYVRRKGVVESRRHRLGFTNRYYVRVPVGTEHQWSDVLRAATPSILGASTVPISIPTPATP